MGVAAEKKSRAIEAKGLLYQVSQFSFILQLHTMRKIFNTTLALSNVLQHKGLDLAKACRLVDVTIEQLQQIKEDVKFDVIYEDAEKFASELLDSDIQPGNQNRIRRAPRHLNDSIICETTGARTSDNDVRTTCRQQYKEVIDKMLAEMYRRFDVKNMEIMKAVQALIPGSDNFLNWDIVQPLATHC